MPPNKDDDHPYCYRGTDVLRNKEDIRDRDELEAFERQQSGNRLETLPHNLPISIEGYREIHRYMLQDVYDWAGEYRTVNTGRTAPFCKVDYVKTEMERRFAKIHAENDLRGLTAPHFAARAAEHINEINAIHPFLDGNGRAQRAFLEILAAQAGHPIDLARIDPVEWNRASVEGFYRANHKPMADIIEGAFL